MITLELLDHRGQINVAVRGQLSGEISKIVRSHPGMTFSITHRCFYFKFERESLEQLKARLERFTKVVDKIVKKAPPEESFKHIPLPEGYEELLVTMRYSTATRDTYISQLKKFLLYIYPLSLEDIDEGAIQSYLLHLVNERNVSISTQNQAINAIKFYYEQVKKGPRKEYYIERPRKEFKLPTVLSEEEVLAILERTKNVKHRCMLLVIYSAGLRISELLNLRRADLDFHRKQIHVRGAKGKKDRFTLLSEFACQVLQFYMQTHWTKHWLFEGWNEQRYSARSVNNIIKRSAAAAGIQKNVSAHTLRHSFATHLLENGYALRYIQMLLGHESSRTTERYTHMTTKGMAQIESPLDSMLKRLGGGSPLNGGLLPEKNE